MPAPPPLTSARRVVSVLFADLVGFTTLSEHLDPEDVATIQQAYFTRARDVVEGAGGVVEKFIGDAVVASFGISNAGGQDGLRAVEAALGIVEAVRETAEALALSDTALQVRVGVNTGEVHATHAVDGSWQLTGNVMNVAARLQAAADPGTVLIGGGTALAAEPAFVLQPAGDLQLKGKSEAVPAWWVVGRRPEPAAVGALYGFSAPTLGREQELASLLGSLVDRGGVPDTWLIVAPPGAGRTRLADELAARATEAGHPVWHAAGGRAGGTFDVVRDLLRAAVSSTDLEAAGARETLIGALSARGRSGTRGVVAADHAIALLHGEVPDEAEPADLFASWAAVLELGLGDVRALWIIDDVDLLPADTLGFVETLLTSSSAARSIVLTARPGSVANLIAEIDAPPSVVRVLHLQPLTSNDVRSLLDAFVGPGVVPVDAADGIAEASGGNPLFVEELVRAWVQAGVLRRQGAEWAFTGHPGPLVLPSTVHAIYQSQLDELPTPSRQVATTGSVPGRSFPDALSSFGIVSPEVGIDDLRSLGLLMGPHRGPAPFDVYTYRHALLRDVAYASLPRADRAQLHLRFATWMDAQSDRELADDLVGTHLAAALESLPDLAEPLEAGGSTWDRRRLGIEAAARLERTAERLTAHEPQRARALLEQAIALDPDAAAPVAVRRFVALGEAQRRVGALEDAMRSFLRTRPGHHAVPAALRVRAALGYEDALFTSRLARSEWGADGLALIELALGSVDDGEGPAQARLLAARGRALAYGGRPSAGKAEAEQAAEVARRCGDSAALASALLSQRATQTAAGDLEGRLAATEEAVAAATSADASEEILEALRLQFVDLLEAGRTDDAATVRRRAEAVIDELRLPVHLWYPPMWRAMEALRTGDPSAGAFVEAFQAEATRWHYRDGRLVHAVQRLHLAVDAEDATQAFALVQPLLEELPDRFAPVMAYGAAAAGQFDLAAELVAVHATSEFARLPTDLSWLYAAVLYAEAAARLGDVESSRVLAGLLEPWAGHLVVLGSGAVCLGDAGGFAGQARAAMGDLDGARRLLSDALARNLATGCAPAAARVQAVMANLGLDSTA